MSGGHFDYKQYHIDDIISELTGDINRAKSRAEYWNYSEDIIKEFETALLLLKKASVYVQRIDWLISADDSEETFHVRLKEELENI